MRLVVAIFRRVRPYAMRICTTLESEEGAQILELAITLPLLVVLMVGIFDFGQAFNTKQKLTTAAREAARFAANQDTSDLWNSPPPSVLAVRDLVSGYLNTNNMTDCGLATSPAVAVATMKWKFTAVCPLPPTNPPMILTVNRGQTFTYSQGGNTYTVESTQVDLSYPFQWRFNTAIKLIVPGANYAGITQLSARTVIPNMN